MADSIKLVEDGSLDHMELDLNMPPGKSHLKIFWPGYTHGEERLSIWLTDEQLETLADAIYLHLGRQIP